MNKNVVRHLITKRIADANPGVTSIYHQLFSLKAWQKARVISVTLSTSIEIPTQPIIRQAWRNAKQVLVPKVQPKRRMIFVPFQTDSKLFKDKFGISEPVNNYSVKMNQIDLMIVPGLAFSKDGDRLGFGGGYYDRCLKSFKGTTVGLARSEQFFNHPIWPVRKWDVQVDVVIRDKGVSRE